MLKQEPLKEQPKQRGAIVNIASQLGIVARPGAGQSIIHTPASHHDTLTLLSCLLCVESSHNQHDKVTRN